jgi:dihydroorotate dehydrogenase (NAD+) catalytic subunit
LPDYRGGGSTEIARAIYKANRSYAWNYAHAPVLPRVRRLPTGPGCTLLGYRVNSPIGIAAGPLLNSKWVEGYARLGFDVLTYSTVRSRFQPAHSLPNMRHVETREQFAVAPRRPHDNGSPTIAVSTGTPSREPDVWRKDMRRAKDRLGPGQILVASVMGTVDPGGDPESLIADYTRCAVWTAEAGADVIEVHLAAPNQFGEPGQMIYENIPLSAQILYRIRTTLSLPLVAKLGVFRTPRLLHETATKLAPWVSGFALVPSIPRRVLDEKGNAAFEGREWVDIVGASTYPVCARQVEEMIAWRKAGAWDHAILAIGGITTVERARDLLNEGANAALVDTAAIFDPLFAVRFRNMVAATPSSLAKVAAPPARKVAAR